MTTRAIFGSKFSLTNDLLEKRPFDNQGSTVIVIHTSHTGVCSRSMEFPFENTCRNNRKGTKSSSPCASQADNAHLSNTKAVVMGGCCCSLLDPQHKNTIPPLPFCLFSVLGSTAGKTCSILPLKLVPSSSDIAFTACSGNMKVTVANPLARREYLQMGSVTSVTSPEKDT